MRRLIGAALSLFLLTVGAFAQEQIQIDNENIQEYKGRLGIWMTVDQAKLNYCISKFSISLKDVQDINGIIALGKNTKYTFIPYSEKYLKELEAQGVKRETVAGEKNNFLWPLIKVTNISSTFGQRGGRFHTGTDMPATKGTPILAVMDGRIISTNYDTGNGNCILIEHRDNFFTRYSHCSEILVKPGEFVRKGQLVGLVGSTGHSTGNHLHFEIRYNDVPLNPLDFLPYKENLVQPQALRNWK